MSSKYLATGLLVSFAVATACAGPGARPRAPEGQPETEQLDRAVAAALASTVEVREQAGPCRVIGARQLLLEGRWIWRITMKPVRLLPDDPSMQFIGAGGEVFVNVDLPAGTTSIRYGE